jgi:iron complex transport system substrate-binding protein
MRQKKTLALLLCAVIAVTLLTGCGNNAADEGVTGSDTPASDMADTTDAGSGTQEESSSRTITDMDGSTIEIPTQVNSVAVLSWPAGEAVMLMLQCQDRMACISEYNSTNAYMLDVWPEMADLVKTPDIGEGNVEELLALGVDLVFGGAIYDYIADAGIPVLTIDTSSPTAIMDTILMMGDTMGEQSYERAQSLCDYYNDNLAMLTAATDSLTDEERPRVYYAASGLLNTEGSGSITNYWMEAGGGINVATENGIEGTFIDISAEELLEWDPDVIVLRDASFYEEIYGDPVLSTLSAVRGDRVYVAPKGVYNWAVRASEAAIMPLWAATIISPELFPDIDIEQETWDFHHTYYGMDLTEDQIFNILHPAGV